MKGRRRTPKLKIKRGDIVQVITGEDAAGRKSGKVLRVFPDSQRALVEGMNLVKKHIRKNQDYPQGGIVEKEAPIQISNLKILERGSRE
jgi:large subunit ribosomal protein L24